MKCVRQKILVRRHKFDDVVFVHEVVSYIPEPKLGRGRLFTPRRMITTALAALFLVFIGANYGEVTDTGAFFSDTETSAGNRFVASLLDFVASGGALGKVTPQGPAIEIPFTVTPEAGSVVTKYRITIENIVGTLSLCDALSVTVKDGTPFAYTGPIAGLNGTAESSVSMVLEASLPSDPGVSPEDECTFDIVARGWNQLVPENTGYLDEERAQVVINDPPAETTTEPSPSPDSGLPAPELLQETTVVIEQPSDEILPEEIPVEKEVPQEEAITEGSVEENSSTEETTPEPPPSNEILPEPEVVSEPVLEMPPEPVVE
ncbi:MAG: hypothetical protein AAB719_00145 [Patescibacteria group bacterium]